VDAVVSAVSAVTTAVVVVSGAGVGCASEVLLASSRASVAEVTVSVACVISSAFVGGGGEEVSGVVAGGAGIRFTDEEGDGSCGCSVVGDGVGSGCVDTLDSDTGVGLAV
jgi:hypothetical protein